MKQRVRERDEYVEKLRTSSSQGHAVFSSLVELVKNSDAVAELIVEQLESMIVRIEDVLVELARSEPPGEEHGKARDALLREAAQSFEALKSISMPEDEADYPP